MKIKTQLLPIFFSLLVNYSVQAQELTNFDDIKLEAKADYKTAEVQVLEASNYLLTTPFNEKDLNRWKSLQFLIKWMQGTPDYTFSLDNVAASITKKNDDLLGLYMAAMAKSVIDDNSLANDGIKLKINSVRLLIKYCQDPNNNMKMTKQLKSLAEADAKGELERAIK